MTKTESDTLITELKRVFDLVRLVDVSEAVQVSFNDDGETVAETLYCYAVWGKTRRCENCISAKAFAQKTKLSKFEFVDGEAYYMVSMYAEVEGMPCVIEMVSLLGDETLFGAYGKSEFADTLAAFNKKMYIDPLTGAYNRRYYEEQLCGLRAIDAVAMVDIDNFKRINDTFGHIAGDAVLKKAADILHAHARGADAVVRYGGDEFLMLYHKIPRSVFSERMEQLRQAVNEAAFEACPGTSVSVSIGAFHCTARIADILPEADRLLYMAKVAKNKVCLGSCL